MNAMVFWMKRWAVDIVLMGIMIIVGSYVLAYSFVPPQQTITTPVQQQVEYVPNTNGIMYFTKAE